VESRSRQGSDCGKGNVNRHMQLCVIGGGALLTRQSKHKTFYVAKGRSCKTVHFDQILMLGVCHPFVERVSRPVVPMLAIKRRG